MIAVNERVGVVLICDAETKIATPYKIKWRRRDYLVKEVAMHLTKLKYGVLHHTYNVSCDGALFVLALNTRNLLWELEEVDYT